MPRLSPLGMGRIATHKANPPSAIRILNPTPSKGGHRILFPLFCKRQSTMGFTMNCSKSQDPTGSHGPNVWPAKKGFSPVSQAGPVWLLGSKLQNPHPRDPTFSVCCLIRVNGICRPLFLRASKKRCQTKKSHFPKAPQGTSSEFLKHHLPQRLCAMAGDGFA